MRPSAADRDREPWALRTVILAMAVLVLAVGFCTFDGHDHDGTDARAFLDLCLWMLAVSLPAALAGGLPLTGLASAYRPVPVRDVAPRVPAPPPKRVS